MDDSLTVVRQFYESVAAGNVERVVSLLAPDLEWTEAERSLYYGGIWRRPQDIVDKLFIPLGKDWEGFSVTPHEFVDKGEQVISFGEYKGTYRATGREMTAPFAHRWEVRGGKIIKFIQYTDTAKVLEATIR